MKKALPYLLVVLGVIGFYWYRYIRAPHVQFVPGEITLAQGQQVLGDITGPAVVHFYASWCGPCMAEMDSLNAMAALYEGKGISFTLVTDDAADQIIRMHLAYPNLKKIEQVASLKEFGVHSIPTTYWINAEQEVVKKNTGKNAWTLQTLNEDLLLLK